MRGLHRLLIHVAVLLLGASVTSAPARGQEGNNPSQAPVVSSDASSAGKMHDDSFVIGNEDVLAVSVWKEPELTKSVPVRSDGKITLPLVGDVQAAGKTPLQLEQDLASKLQNFITSPSVTVSVEKVNSRKFNILGEVGRPGSFPLTASMTVMDAIATAGGFKDFAKKTGVYILRKAPDGSQTRLNFNYKEFIKGKNPSQNVKLEPNDTVIVP